MGTVIRVVRRHVGEREHFAGAHIERDDRAGLGAVLQDCSLERAEGEILDLAVDGQGEVASVLRFADRLHVLDDVAEPVLEDAPASRLAAEACLVRELDAFLTVVVDPGEADDVSRDFAAWVVAPVFAMLVNALQPERRDALRDIGRHLALEVDEIARWVRELPRKFIACQAEQGCELAPLGARELRVGRDRPDRLYRGGHRERLAVAIKDAAARRRHFDEARVARVAFLLQEVGLQRLQVQRTRAKHRERCQQRRKHKARAPDRQAHQALRRSIQRAAPGVTMRTRLGSGARRRSVPVAIFSTRECRPQVLASSCSRPYSISRSRARFCSRSSSENSLRALC